MTWAEGDADQDGQDPRRRLVRDVVVSDELQHEDAERVRDAVGCT